MLDAIRARFPPPIVFHIDCNGGYDLKHDYEFLCAQIAANSLFPIQVIGSVARGTPWLNCSMHGSMGGQASLRRAGLRACPRAAWFGEGFKAGNPGTKRSEY